jgi:hypothetical protein
MFDFIKVTRKAPPSRRKHMARFDLKGRPFANALLLRTSHHFDETYKDLKKLTGKDLKVSYEEALADFAASSAVLLARQVTHDALAVLGYEPVFTPFDPLPDYAPTAFAFGAFILRGLERELEIEGIKVDSTAMAAELAMLNLLERPKAEQREMSQQFFNAFTSLLGKSADEIGGWHKDLMNVVHVYVLQWTSTSETTKSIDIPPILASLLGSLFQSVGLRAAHDGRG